MQTLSITIIFKINYCNTSSIYLSLDKVKMYLLLVFLSLSLVNQYTLHFKVTSENTFRSPRKVNGSKTRCGGQKWKEKVNIFQFSFFREKYHSK